MNHPKGDESPAPRGRCSQCPQQLCTAAEPSPDKLRYCGRGGHFRGGTYAAGSAPFLAPEPSVPLAGRAKPGWGAPPARPKERGPTPPPRAITLPPPPTGGGETQPR